jgi:hypothetical protein
LKEAINGLEGSAVEVTAMVLVLAIGGESMVVFVQGAKHPINESPQLWLDLL